jgi:serine/threonine protein kinase
MPTTKPALMTFILSTYRIALLGYPQAHRRAYSDEMMWFAEMMCTDAYAQKGTWGLVQVTGRLLADTLVNVGRERLTPQEADMNIPEKIDHYQIRERIGGGSIQTVYRAHDTQQERDVALLVTQPASDDTAYNKNESMRDAVRQEYATLQQLQHPRIPRVHQLVERDDVQYMVMDFIAGTDLLVRIDASPSPLPTQKVLRWFIGVCDILHDLHTQAPPLLYRDVKPANIMVDGDSVMLLDFGIAVPYEVGKQYDLIGTIGYASPEQYKGNVDMRSDIYGVGASLHHALTRRDPRQHPAHTFHDAKPRMLNPSLPIVVEDVILRATAHNPDERYQTMADLRDALQACLISA